MVTSEVERLGIDAERLAELCERWGVARLQLFGSFARGEARPDSDVDLMVTFLPGRTPGFAYVSLIDELSEAFGRDVDLVSPRVLENPYRKPSIECDLILLYEAA
jgi:predicted nucleotidyltransferase